METTAKDNQIQQNLDALNAECEKIFATYLQQVSANAHSGTLAALKDELKQVRNKQWQLFEQLDQVYSGKRVPQIAA
jgi:ribulose kinase